MSGLKLYSGNRLEALAAELAHILREPLSSPLCREVIVVQSKGMERWVSMELARRHGICANCSFPFPRVVVEEVFRHVLGEIPAPSPFDPDVLTWKIMGLLPGCVERPGFETLRGYIAKDPEQLKRFQLSGRIADLFDQYLLYRPDLISAWENGTSTEGGWQPLLWLELARRAEWEHPAALRGKCLAKLAASTVPPPGLPERLAIFGISSLPPFYMEVLRALARFIPVNLFLMNPCQEYWGEIRSEREMSRISRRQARRDGAREEALYLEQGNSLLASMGKLGRDFFQLTQELTDESAELFEEPGEESLLGCIQTDILHLEERDPQNKTLIALEDRSIALHSCHSPMREIEVLYDQLLALFEEEPDLSPRDVLVMTPDIDAYAPFIHAVFDAPEQPALKIPFTITDRNLRGESRIIEAFLLMLDLVGSRLGAPQVLALLESEALRRRFGLAEEDVPLIHRWVNETRIRWGEDARSRTALGFGSFLENSWQAGLDRLLLGYALPGGEERLFEGVLPYDHIEGSEAAVLGRFLELIERLFATLDALAHPRPLEKWAEALKRVLDSFFAPSDDGSEKEAQALRQVLNDLAEKQQAASFTDPVTIEVVRGCLKGRMEAATMGLGFITGGVTFCAMLPMRSIPFEVICLVGMDDGAFPRRNRSLGFDLMARSPRLGDRSQRSDDRYMFLEALLSARRRFYVSYVGQSQEDNTPLPPSVLVSELLDAVRKGYAAQGTDDILEHLATRHRLQPFSLQYFKGEPKYFSYSEENCRAGQDACGAQTSLRPFIESRIPEPEPEWRTIDVAQLTAFFAHPGKFLVNRRLQVQMEWRETSAEDREVFELDYLERYKLEEHLLARRIAGHDLNGLFPAVKASGRLPHGAVGVCRYGLLTGSVETFYTAVAPYVQAPGLPPLSVGLRLPPFKIEGRIDGMTALGLLHFRSASVKPKDHLNLWIRHLLVNTSTDRNTPRAGFLIGKDAALQYAPVEGAERILENLLALYWEGLQRQIHFFPRSSYAYAQKRFSGGSREEALKAARSEWEPSFQPNRPPGECEDTYMNLCFSRCEALDDEFEALAMEILQPLLEHQRPVG